jgi:hypothetical protein
MSLSWEAGRAGIGFAFAAAYAAAQMADQHSLSGGLAPGMTIQSTTYPAGCGLS